MNRGRLRKYTKRDKEKVEAERGGSCEREKESQGRDEARLRGERATGKHSSEEHRKLWRARCKISLQSVFIILLVWSKSLS